MRTRLVLRIHQRRENFDRNSTVQTSPLQDHSTLIQRPVLQIALNSTIPTVRTRFWIWISTNCCASNELRKQANIKMRLIDRCNSKKTKEIAIKYFLLVSIIIIIIIISNNERKGRQKKELTKRRFQKVPPLWFRRRCRGVCRDLSTIRRRVISWSVTRCAARSALCSGSR